MKKKTIIRLVLSIIASIVMVYSFVYVPYKAKSLENKTYDFLAQRGYVKADVSFVKVTHSPFNALLSYRVWNITVEFADEPNVWYYFSPYGDTVSHGGVTGVTNTDDLKHTNLF